MINKILAALLSIGLSVGQALNLDIKITEGTFRLIPIMIQPFAAPGAALAETIAHDLTLSGEFEVRQSVPKAVWQTQDIKSYRAYGADYAVTGKILATQGSNYQIRVDLWDLYGKQTQLSSKEFNAKAQDFKYLAHRMADLIYEAITQHPGFFRTRIAYVCVNRTASGQALNRLVITSIDGHDPQVILTSPEPIMSPAWSPDGRYLAYVSFEQGNSAIYLSDVVTGKRQQITASPGINAAPAWSPDGKKLAIVLSKQTAPDLYIYHLSSKQLTRLTNDHFINTEPTWSPDGQWIYFTSDRGGSPQIYKLALSNKQIKRVTYQGPYNASPSLLPDGQHLLTLHRAKQGFEVAMHHLSSGQVQVLTDDGFVESFALGPSGKVLLYTSNKGSKKVLTIQALRGTIKHRFNSIAGFVKDPAWAHATDERS